MPAFYEAAGYLKADEALNVFYLSLNHVYFHIHNSMSDGIAPSMEGF